MYYYYYYYFTISINYYALKVEFELKPEGPNLKCSGMVMQKVGWCYPLFPPKGCIVHSSARARPN